MSWRRCRDDSFDLSVRFWLVMRICCYFLRQQLDAWGRFLDLNTQELVQRVEDNQGFGVGYIGGDFVEID
jgi:hypothetical protein